MTVIFQLFRVDDLKMLGQDGRGLLRDIIQRVLEVEPYKKPDKPPEVCLEASNNTKLKSDDNTPQQVLEALQRRIATVTEQLQAPLSSSPSGSPRLDPSQPIVAAPTPRDLTPQQEAEIRQWAISCEVNNFNFYYTLLLIKEIAYTMFSEKTGKRPRGPDSPYSPLNERHPLYELFNNLKLINERHPLYEFFNAVKERAQALSSS
jgi:hypothetical protein